jgi:dipeptidyl aminopeptidase/acylaminoacyl peptidase
MAHFYCSGVVAALLFGALLPGVAAPAAASQIQPGENPPGETRGYIVFLRGRPIGREDVTTTRTPDGVVISGRGRLTPPIDVVTSKVEVRYRSDWTPESLLIESSVQGRQVTLKTSFSGTEASSETIEDGKLIVETDTISPKTVVIPNLFFGTYEALATRLVGAVEGAEFPAYVAPEAEVPIRVRAISTDRVQTGNTILALRRYDLSVANPDGELLIQLTADDAGHLVRLSVPFQSLDIVREDVAGASARSLTYANPGDEPVTIPAYGFNIAATVTRPTTAGTERLPAVVLLAGSGANDRDGVTAGVPIISQLAGALADAGFLAVRYDKRGYGQSGGRAEAATLDDFVTDARTVVKYVSKRKDVDKNRVAIVGHSEGAWVALLAAAREKRVKAVVSIAGAGSTGAELILEQQRHALDQMNAPEAERHAKIELQEKIHQAVLNGKGWDEIPEPLRQAADTPWFESLLRFDPAKVVKKVKQPILIVQGDLDRQVPLAHADQLVALAQRRGTKRVFNVEVIPGVNHLLAAARTGEVSEYATLEDLNVSGKVSTAITGWLSRTLIVR